MHWRHQAKADCPLQVNEKGRLWLGVTQGACAGHPAAPNASNQVLSNNRGSLLLLPPQGPARPISLRGLIRITIICPRAWGSDNQLPFNKHTSAEA